MEVHHHTHHGKQKGVQYFREFLMLYHPVLINKAIVRARYVKKLDPNQVVRASELKNPAIALIDVVKRNIDC